MKIPNYDTNKNGKQNKRLNNFLDEDYRMFITGQTKCGKTNTLMHMSRTPLVYYDKIYLYAPNQHQDKLQDLEKIMDKISEKTGYPVLEIGSADDIKTPRKIKQPIISQMGVDKISPICLTQSYYDVLQKLRQIAPL